LALTSWRQRGAFGRPLRGHVAKSHVVVYPFGGKRQSESLGLAHLQVDGVIARAAAGHQPGRLPAATPRQSKHGNPRQLLCDEVRTRVGDNERE
ncbi:MAG TPA: hypothetical protein VM715_05270, partial [Candidatus Acidoferrum sp.]|nr:hypothetical protein [Candidatus Acidoferrum sp.]